MPYLLRLANRGFRRFGPLKLLRMGTEAVADQAFDLWYGTDTRGWFEVHQNSSDPQSPINTSEYGPTLYRPFRSLLERLALPPEATFVDIGCGKGKAMLVAALCGFRRIAGVEHSAALCSTARANWEKFSRGGSIASTFDVIEGDAREFEFPDGELVIYLYHPFGPEVFEAVLSNLRRSLLGRPRRVWLIYQNLASHDAIKATGMFESACDFEFGGLGFTVFTGTPLRPVCL